MRTVARTTIALLLAVLISGMATIFLGLYNVSGRGGHWPVVNWVLHTTYGNSVKLRAPSPDRIPPLDDPDLVTLGARHYELACASCHGAPGARQSKTMQSMVPAPPSISKAVARWQPNHLFWIIKNGVKMTGMPHWPALERDDDIWPVVAFLNRLPMNFSQYQGLLNRKEHSLPATPVVPDTAGGERSEQYDCTLCHGKTGRSDNAYIPSLDILSRQYLSETLTAYREQQRSSGIMQQAASRLDDDTIEILARHYASPQFELAGTSSSTGTDSAGTARTDDRDAEHDRDRARSGKENASSIDRGRILATGHATAEPSAADTSKRADVPVCSACHGPWPVALSPNYPSLAAQPENFLLTQLQLWKSGNRGGTRLSSMMHKVVPDLDFQQMQDLAAYYAQLPSARGPDSGHSR